MVEIIKAQPIHFEQIEIQPSQEYILSLKNRKDHAKILELSKCSFSAVEGDVCHCIAGIVEIEPWRALAWSLFGKDVKKHMAAVFRSVKRVLDVQEYDRIELVCYADFEPSIRWSKLLGFEQEGILRKYYPGGRDGIMFSRIR